MANALIQVAPVPSLAKARQTALTARGMETRNALARQQLQDYPEERAWTKETRQRRREEWTYSDEDREFQRKIKAISLALDAPNTQTANSILEYSGVTDFKIGALKDGKQKVTFPGIEIDADKRVLKQLIQTFEDNPGWYKNPEIVRQVLNRSIKLGADVKIEKPKETPEEKLERAKDLAKYKEEIKAPKEIKDIRTSRQKEYDRFKKDNSTYKGSIIDFKKAMQEKDPDQVALELAAKDWKVLSGAKSLADAAIEYRKTWSILKEGKSELPTGLTEATIKFNMDKYGKTREEVIDKYKQMKGIK